MEHAPAEPSAFESLLSCSPALLNALPKESLYDVAATSWSALEAALRHTAIDLQVSSEGALLDGIARRISPGTPAAGTLYAKLHARSRSLVVGVPPDEAGVLAATLARCQAVREQESELDPAEVLEAVLHASEELGTPLRLRAVKNSKPSPRRWRCARVEITTPPATARLQAVLDRPVVQRHLRELRWADWGRDEDIFETAVRWVSALQGLRVLECKHPISEDDGSDDDEEDDDDDETHPGEYCATATGALAFAAAIRGDTSALTDLRVRTRDGGLPLRRLCEGVAHNETIRTLELGLIDVGEWAESDDCANAPVVDGELAAQEHPLQKLLSTNTTLRKLEVHAGHPFERRGGAFEPDAWDRHVCGEAYTAFFAALGRGLATNTSLQELQIMTSPLLDCGPEMGAFFDGLARNTSLRGLVMSDRASGDAIGELASALRRCRLERLQITVDLQDEQFGAVADALAANSHVEELRLLPDVPRGGSDVTATVKLARAIREGALGRTLRELSLSLVCPALEVFRPLCDALGSSKVLQSLDVELKGTVHGEHSTGLLASVASMIDRSQSLKRLRARGLDFRQTLSPLAAEAVNQLAAGLSGNAVLEHLVLDDCVEVAVATRVVDALGPRSALRHLHLTSCSAHNPRGDEGDGLARAFARAFDRGVPLAGVDIWSVHCFVRAEACKTLLAAAARSECLGVCEVRVRTVRREEKALMAWYQAQVDARKVRFRADALTGATVDKN
ncbi:unnamed protein product [Pedinophyceae sp. YPF-701]|nr:unnamed protein product [Pedinophyceae sp. YPF-701]